MSKSRSDSPHQWLEEHGDALYRYAMRHTRDPHRAEDAVQETLLAALQSRDRFTGNASVRTWLIGILKYKIMDMFRRDAREVPLETTEEAGEDQESLMTELFNAADHWRDLPANWGKPEEVLQGQQFMHILRLCLETLSKPVARLFWLREVMEEDSESICKELAITPTNLWTMLYRARMGLRRCLEKNWVV